MKMEETGYQLVQPKKDKEPLKVRIKSNPKTGWYKGMKGQTFDVYKVKDMYYIQSDYDSGMAPGGTIGVRYISEEDLEIV